MQLYTRPGLKGQPTRVDEGEGSLLTAVPVAPKTYHEDKMRTMINASQMC